ncbi:MAG TPA: carbohydrate kinase [Actinomycetes bacterium]|nr:carbohydrate kinase [Actinomycetes bacterium]
MFAVVGEALVDVVNGSAYPGGSPANVALGLARLGRPVRLWTRLGRDSYGDLIKDHLQQSGVVVPDDSIDDDPTSSAIATLDERGRASYEFDISWDVHLPSTLPDDVVTLHTGSLATVLAPGRDAVAELIRREHARGHTTISLDLNARPSLVDDHEELVKRLDQLIPLAHVVKMSEEDLEYLWPGDTFDIMAERLLATGDVAIVLVTRGPDGAWASTRQTLVEVAAPEVELVDTVGAGDAFTAGLLDALATAGLLGAGRADLLARQSDEEIRRLIEAAALVAAITCSRRGANPPTADEVASYRATHST